MVQQCQQFSCKQFLLVTLSTVNCFSHSDMQKFFLDLIYLHLSSSCTCIQLMCCVLCTVYICIYVCDTEIIIGVNPSNHLYCYLPCNYIME